MGEEVKKRRKGHTRISRKHQVTIPVAALAAAGLRPGDELKVFAVNGSIVLEPVEDARARRLEAIRETAGALTGVYPPGDLAALRDEWR